MADTSNKKKYQRRIFTGLKRLFNRTRREGFPCKTDLAMDLAKRGDGFRRDEQLIEGYPGIIKPALFLRFPLSAAGADSQRRHRKNSLAADRRRNRRERTDSRKSKIHGLCIFTSGLSAGVQILCNRYPGF